MNVRIRYYCLSRWTRAFSPMKTSNRNIWNLPWMKSFDRLMKTVNNVRWRFVSRISSRRLNEDSQSRFLLEGATPINEYRFFEEERVPHGPIDVSHLNQESRMKTGADERLFRLHFGRPMSLWSSKQNIKKRFQLHFHPISRSSTVRLLLVFRRDSHLFK